MQTFDVETQSLKEKFQGRGFKVMTGINIELGSFIYSWRLKLWMIEELYEMNGYFIMGEVDEAGNEF